MAAVVGTALIIGAIAACVSPFYYCKESKGVHDDDSENTENTESESPVVHIKIRRPRREKCVSASRTQNSASKLDSGQVTNDLTSNVKSFSRETSEIVPVKPPRIRKNLCYVSEGSQDTEAQVLTDSQSSIRNQVDSSVNSLSECGPAGSIRIVKAQIEPNRSVLTNTGASNTRNSDHVLPDDVDSVKSSSSRKTTRSRRFSAAVSERWRYLKRMINSRSRRSTPFKSYSSDETERLHITLKPFDRPSPAVHSDLFTKTQMKNVSTSTRLGSSIQNRGEGQPEWSEDSRKSRSHSFDSNSDQRLIQLNRSIDGPSICDVRITGLALNQSDVLDLFEATNGKPQSASIIRTEESSIISIRFQKERRSSEIEDKRNSNLEECSLKKLYKSLPEKLEEANFRLFRSKKRSFNVADFSDDSSVEGYGIDHVIDQKPIEEANNFSERFVGMKIWRFLRRR